MTRIISAGLYFLLATASMALRGLGRSSVLDDRARIGVAQGLARFVFGVRGGQPSEVLRGVEAGQRFKEVFHIFKWVQPVQLGGGDQAVITGTHLPAFSRTEEEVVLFADGGGPDRAFDGVVVQGQVGVVEHGQEVGPLVEGVAMRLSKFAFGQVALRFDALFKADVQALINGAAFALPGAQNFFRAGFAGSQSLFNLVKLLDLAQDRSHVVGCLLARFDKFPPNVGEAGDEFDVAGAVFAQFWINGIAIADDVTAPSFGQEFFKNFGSSAGGPVEIGADSGGVDDPEVALFGLAVAGAKVFDRRFVYVQEVAEQDCGFEVAQDAGEPDFMGHASPAAHGLPGQPDAVAGFINLFLPIIGQMVGVFTSDNIGKSAGAKVAVFLQGGKRGDDGDAGAGLGQVFDDGNEDGSDDDQFAKFRWGDVEQFGLRLTDFTIGIGRCDDFGGKQFALDDGAVRRKYELGATGGLFASGGGPDGLWGRAGTGRRWWQRKIRRCGQGTCEEAGEQEFARSHGGEAFALLAVQLLVEILYLADQDVDLLLLLRDDL